MKFAKLSRKIIAMSLAACMVTSCAVTSVGSYTGLSTTVNAAETTASDFEYYTLSDGTVKITKYNGTAENVVIPSKINGADVTIIGSVFYRNKTVKSVVIPNTVKEIGTQAFEECTGLTSVKMGNGVEEIGNSAFEGCTGLTNITIPDSVTLIGEYAFAYSGLTSVTIPNSVTSIKNRAFKKCTGLTSVTIPDSVEVIDEGVFVDCTGLTSVKIGNGVKEIGDAAFSGCTGLTNITIPDSVTLIGEYAFALSGLTSVTIPNSVTSIKNGAFKECTGLTRVIIPNSVVSIGDSVFENCTSLTSINIPVGVKSIGRLAFFRCDKLKSITVDKNNKNYLSQGGILFNKNKTELIVYPHSKPFGTSGTYTIPDGVTSIGENAFYNRTDLTNITIPDSVTSIGNYAFYGCSELTSLTIPDGVTSIGNYAFSICIKLKSLTIPDSVISIGDHAFECCTQLVNLSIPDSVISMGSYIFIGTEWYDNQPDGMIYLGKVAYYYKGNMPENTSITIKSGTKGIAKKAFFSKKNLKSITIPDSVVSIGESAFYECEGLTSVNIPKSVTSMGDDIFNKCTGLKSVTIQNGVKSISDRAFENCTALTDVIIPDSVEEIGCSAFKKCTALTNIKTGNGVKKINEGAFDCCSGLTSVTLGSSVTEIFKSAFWGCSGLTSLTMLNSNTKIDPTAFYNSLKFNNCTIYGYKDSTAEKLALDNDLKFVALLCNKSTIDSTSVNLGGTVTIKGAATGGTAPYRYSVIVKHSSAKDWTVLKDYSTTPTVIWKPELIGKYRICVKVRDAKNDEVNKFFNLTINEPLANNSTISKTTINKGDSITLKAVATGGTSPYQYAFSVKHSTATAWTYIKSYNTTATKTWKPAYTGTYSVCAKIKDSTGTEVKKFFTLTVNASLTNNSTISSTEITKGDSITLTGKATGGTAPYQYAFSVKHSTATKWTTIKSYSTTATKTWKPAYTGTYSVCAKVKDSKGTEVKKFFTLTINAPLANNSTISKTTINKGDSITLKAVATGGTAPYQYSFTVKHSTATAWSTIQSYGTTDTKTWKPAKTGTYQLCAKVKDATGKEVKKFFNLTVK